MAEPSTQPISVTPFLELTRKEWSALAPHTPQPFAIEDLAKIVALGDRLDLAEVAEVYVPLSGLLNRYATGVRGVRRSVADFLQRPSSPTPFIIGVAGSVAVGKSTVARLLRKLLSGWEGTPRVELVTTDGFLYPNAELLRRGIMTRKGFPESYDRRALLRFVQQVKSGAAEVRAPVYSHLHYDILPNASLIVNRPDVLIVEGLNVLQPPLGGAHLAVSDLFDFSIYVDARTSDIKNWYVDRFLGLQRGAFADPDSYFHRYADLTEETAIATASGLWDSINGPNLEQNVLPTRARASLVLRKAADHTVSSVLLRKV